MVKLNLKSENELTVGEIYNFLGELIESGRGDYKIKIDVNEYYINLKNIQTIDEHIECGNKIVIFQ